MSEPPNASKLRRAVNNASIGGAGGRIAVLREFLQTDVVVPLLSLSEPGWPAHILTAQDSAGQEVLAVFTCLEELGRWIERDVSFGGLSARKAAETARERRLAGIVIDPGSGDAVALTAAEVNLLADGILPSAEGNGRVFAIRHVREPTHEIPKPVLAVAGDLVLRPEVAAIYLYEASYSDDELAPEKLTLGIRVKPSKRARCDDVLRELVERARATLPVGLAVDIVDVDDALEAELAQIVRPVVVGRGQDSGA
jgi:hypothetical protein